MDLNFDDSLVEGCMEVVGRKPFERDMLVRDVTDDSPHVNEIGRFEGTTYLDEDPSPWCQVRFKSGERWFYQGSAIVPFGSACADDTQQLEDSLFDAFRAWRSFLLHDVRPRGQHMLKLGGTIMHNGVMACITFVDNVSGEVAFYNSEGA